MGKLPLVSEKDLCKTLERLGFFKVHQKGSHARQEHPNGRRMVVPVHGNEKLGVGLINAILKPKFDT